MRNLDKNLNTEDSLVHADRPEIALKFDTKTDRNAVRSRNLAGGQVSTDQIADEAVTSDKIAQLTITAGDIANGAVTSVKMGGTVSDKLITGGTIGTALIGTSTIVGGTINNATLGTPTIVGGTFSGISLSGTYNNLSLGSPTIVGGTIDKMQLIGTSQITGGTFSNGLVGTSNITGGTVTALIGTSQITGGTLTSVTYNNAVLGSPSITGGTIANMQLIGTTQITGGTATSINLGTPLINAGTSGVTTLIEPRIGAFLRQDDTTDAYKPNTGVLIGWGQVTGSGTTYQEEAVTFGNTFSETPIVLVTNAGAKALPEASDLSEFNANGGVIVWSSYGVSTTGFTAFTARPTGSYGTGFVYAYTWMAIGQT